MSVEQLSLDNLNGRRSRRWIYVIGLLGLMMAPRTCDAGVGPENLILVVNADSWESRTIANHYAELRKIPTRNIVVLKNVPAEPVTTLEKFREQILKPLLAEIDVRGLAPQTRVIGYSSGFPYAVNIKEHHSRLKDATLKKVFTSTASLNGLTYFYRFILADKEEYLNTSTNFYARSPWERHFINPFLGDDASAFEAAKQAVNEANYATAGADYAKLFDKYPTQPPLGILSAEAYLLANDHLSALNMLERAIASGWVFRSHFDDNKAYDPLRADARFKKMIEPLSDVPAMTQDAIGFESSRGWTSNGWWLRADQTGITYLPSFVLAVTRWEGTTVSEAIDYLKRASDADGTFPKGMVYLMLTGDVRTTTRSGSFPETLLRLKELGGDGRIERATLPIKKKDCIGLTMGASAFDWPSSGSVFLPGALADNLTSTGGLMHAEGQTKLTELLKGGAAAASGTVTEPYALQFKFPLPQMHAFYAEGTTAVEAFYLSVANPYQLLIVGDPLCQPYAKAPVEQMAGRVDNVAGKPTIVMQTKLPNPVGNESASDPSHASPLSEVEFYIDGKLVYRSPPQDQYRITLDNLGGGSYEVRSVLVGEARLAPRKSIQTWIETNGILPSPTIVLTPASASPTPTDAGAAVDKSETVRLQLDAPGADSIRVMHHGEEIASVTGEKGLADIARQPLGSGPLRVRAIANYRGTEVPGKEFVID